MAPGSDGEFSTNEKAKEVYFVSNFTDWMPIKMKTKRHLALEKIPMNEPAPP